MRDARELRQLVQKDDFLARQRESARIDRGASAEDVGDAPEPADGAVANQYRNCFLRA